MAGKLKMEKEKKKKEIENKFRKQPSPQTRYC
jgi:hypothetical protein